MSTIVRPPGPRGEASRQIRRRYLEAPWDFLQELQQTYGDIVYFKVGLQDVYLVSDPALIHDVLVANDVKFARTAGPNRGYSRLVGDGALMTSEGMRYRRQRRLVQPALHQRRLGDYAEIMVDHSERLVRSIHPGEARDVHRDMLHLTLGIVVRSLFGAELPEDRVGELSGSMNAVLEAFDRQGARWVAMESPKTRAAIERLDAIVYGLIRERRADAADRGDLLSMLLLARDDEGDGTGMSDEEVRAEVLTLVAAGHDTTSAALAWTWYLLSQHPEAESRLHDEIDDVLGGRRPMVEDLRAMRYLDMLVSESMRLYPPSGLGTDRFVMEEHELAGYTIPVGSIILMSQYVVQRDPRWFDEPDRFVPERWEHESRDGRPRFSYFPFSGGSRTCVGMSFALMEVPFVIATIARTLRFELERGHPVEIDARVSMKPKQGMRMVPVRRG